MQSTLLVDCYLVVLAHRIDMIREIEINSTGLTITLHFLRVALRLPWCYCCFFDHRCVGVPATAIPRL